MPKLTSNSGCPFQKVIVDETTGADSLADDDVHTVPHMPRSAKPSFRLNISVMGPL